MADNLKQLIGRVNEVLDNTKGPNWVKVLDHNDIEQQIINKTGKNTGFPFLASANGIDGKVPIGTISWNGNLMNNTDLFTFTLSEKTLDFNKIEEYLKLLAIGSLIHFKDFVGRSVILKYHSYVKTTDSGGNNILNVSVNGVVDNINYAYQSNEYETCIIEFFNNIAHTHPISDVTGLPTALDDLQLNKEDKSNKNIANGYAGLDSSGKIIPTQLPALAITDTFVVNSQAAMLALVAEVGDVAVRNDLNKSFILRVTGASTLANWQELLSPTSVDQTIIDGSTNAVSGNAVFDGLATKAPISSVHNPVTLGTANGLSLSTQQLSLGLASSGVTGALSGTDWNTFNNKENAFIKNTAFNKNFGTTAGTVVEGNYPPAKNGTGASGTWGININGSANNSILWNGLGADFSIYGSDLFQGIGYDGTEGKVKPYRASDWSSWLGLGTNAYSSTAYLPLSGGTLSGALNGTSGNFSSSVTATKLSVSSLAIGTQTLLELGEPGYVATNYGSVLESSSTTGLFSLFNYNAGVKSTTPVLSWSRVNSKMTFGVAATFASTVTASPATLPNHVVVKSQLDAVAGTSGSYTPTLTPTNAVSVVLKHATYQKIGNIVTVRISVYFTPTSTTLYSGIECTLPFNRATAITNNMGSGVIADITAYKVAIVQSMTTTTTNLLGLTGTLNSVLMSVVFQYSILE